MSQLSKDDPRNTFVRERMADFANTAISLQSKKAEYIVKVDLRLLPVDAKDINIEIDEEKKELSITLLLSFENTFEDSDGFEYLEMNQSRQLKRVFKVPQIDFDKKDQINENLKQTKNRLTIRIPKVVEGGEDSKKEDEVVQDDSSEDNLNLEFL